MKRLPVLLWLLALSASAQTATWIGPGANGSYADWSNPANWDTGAVPDSGSAHALVSQFTILTCEQDDSNIIETKRLEILFILWRHYYVNSLCHERHENNRGEYRINVLF